VKKILIDSDVLIAYLRDDLAVVMELEHLAASEAILAITPIAEAEIRRGMRSNERRKTEEALRKFECLEFDRSIGEKAGDYLRQYGKSHGLELPDAFVAAAATIHRFALCTFNWKHYPMSEIIRHRIE
jgi:predicted nucleic acid-binding protein